MRKIVLTLLCLCLINVYILPVKAAEFSSHEVTKGRIITVPAGESFTAKMQSSVSSGTLKPGDSIAAVLDKNWVYQDTLIAPAGSILYGNAIQVQKAGRSYKNGEIELRFNEIITPQGHCIPIASNSYVLGVDENRTKNIAATVGETVVYSTFLNMLTDNEVKDIPVSASIGILDGLLNSFAVKGNDVELPRNTIVKVKLSHHIYVNIYG